MFERWLKREWPKVTVEEAHFFGSLVHRGDLVFDVGANLGNKSAIFRSLGARVVAFEPQPACVDQLRRRFGRDRRVEIVASGVAAQPGELELSICSEASTISTFSEEWKHGRFEEDFEWDQRVAVPVTTLDESIARWGAPAFIKIDVEGYELEVISGLSTAVGAISFEFAQELIDRAVEAIAALAGKGYRSFNVGQGENAHFEFPDWIDSDTVSAYMGGLPYPSWGDVYASVDIAGPKA